MPSTMMIPKIVVDAGVVDDGVIDDGVDEADALSEAA